MAAEPDERRPLGPTWSAERIRRALTDEPSKGLGSPFSARDAHDFLRAYELTDRLGGPRVDPALLDRMWRWLDEHLDES